MKLSVLKEINEFETRVATTPEYEFNIDITTGISAPPIGITTSMPKIIEIITMVQNIDDD